MAHHEYLVSVVFNELELIAGLPIIRFFKNFNIVKLIVFAIDHTSLILNVVITISHKDLIQAFNLLMFICFVITNFNITLAIAVYTKVQFAIQLFEGLGLPIHIYV